MRWKRAVEQKGTFEECCKEPLLWGRINDTHSILDIYYSANNQKLVTLEKKIPYLSNKQDHSSKFYFCLKKQVI